MKTIVTFSGGKDSMAALLWIKNNFTKNFEVVFCDTGWESEITYNYIKDVCDKLGKELIVLKSKKYDGFIDMVEKKKRFPSTKARFCTIELKTIPMIDYLLDVVKDDFVVVQGIRKAESESRSKMQEQCNYFKYYFEPYSTNEITIQTLESSKKKLTSIQQKKLQKAKERLEAGKNDEKYHTYRKKEVIKFSNGRVTDVLRPIFEWSGQQTIEYILENGFDPNPLYKMGMKRVGCFPCIMSANMEIHQLAERFPERIKEITQYEQTLNSSFWGPDSIPKRTYKGKFPLVPDVVRYVKSKHEAGTLFDDNEATSCMSYYGLCE